MYFNTQTEMILVFVSCMGRWWQEKGTQYVPSTKVEYDYFCGWIKRVTYAKISPEIVDLRDWKEDEEAVGLKRKW